MKLDTSKNGIHSMVPYEQMCESAKKLRDIYALKHDAPFIKREFGYYCLDRWYEQGLPKDVDLTKVFDYDPPGHFPIHHLGWCEAAFEPKFDEKIVEDRGEYEVVQDFAGRKVLVFKGKRSGFMPEYLDHPVKNMETWEQDIKWRLDPSVPQRYADLPERMKEAVAAAGEGIMITQRIIGGYMYLRSLIGPESLLYKFYDEPELIHDCMKSWFELGDAVTASHQKYVSIDELFFAEDICYNVAPLISPDMMKEFLFPYYQQLIRNMKTRQLDKQRHLYIQVDTDGCAESVIPAYIEAIGMDVMSPFEVAAGSDVVKISKKYPTLVMMGGIDKRILAQDKDAIDRHLEYILPPLKKRGGYIPTCDHGVPEEVSFENYLHYRKRCVELGS